MKKIVLLFFLSGLCCPIGVAQLSGARFLLRQPSAVSYSLGGAGTSFTSDAFSTFSNPAGVAFSYGLSIGMSLVKPFPFFENIVYGYSTATLNMGTFGGLGVSGNFFQRGGQERSAILGVKGQEIDNYLNYEMKLTYARTLNENLGLGVSVGVLRQILSDNLPVIGTSTSLLFDFGIQLRNIATSATLSPDYDENLSWLGGPSPTSKHLGISLGLSLLNIGRPIYFIDAGKPDLAPTVLLFGIAYSPLRLQPFGVMIAIEAEKRLNDKGISSNDVVFNPWSVNIDRKTVDLIHVAFEAKIF